MIFGRLRMITYSTCSMQVWHGVIHNAAGMSASMRSNILPQTVEFSSSPFLDWEQFEVTSGCEFFMGRSNKPQSLPGTQRLELDDMERLPATDLHAARELIDVNTTIFFSETQPPLFNLPRHPAHYMSPSFFFSSMSLFFSFPLSLFDRLCLSDKVIYNLEKITTLGVHILHFLLML